MSKYVAWYIQDTERDIEVVDGMDEEDAHKAVSLLNKNLELERFIVLAK